MDSTLRLRNERVLVGLLTVLEVLQLAERCRVVADPEKVLDEGGGWAVFWRADDSSDRLVRRLGQSNFHHSPR